MEQNQALEIIKQALDVATRKGCYTIQEVEAILKALQLIVIENNETR